MSIPVVWVDGHPLCWDQHIVDRLLPEPLFEHREASGVKYGLHPKGAVVVIPARYYAKQLEQVRATLTKLPWSVVLLTSDEEGTFYPDAIDGWEFRQVWVQTPRDPSPRMLPVGPPPDSRNVIGIDRPHDWVFAGQVTHERRQAAAEVMRTMPGGVLHESPGFLQGLDRADYLALLATAKAAPCPSGPETPDTFRMWEALEAGCVPILDAECPRGGAWYWDALLGAHPLPIIPDWKLLPEYVDDIAAGWPANANRVGAWWLTYQRNLRRRLWRDIAECSRADVGNDRVTVLIPTSPIPSHPDTAMIEQTVGSVRFHYPDADILIMCDGVRPAQDARRHDYEAYLQQLVGLCRTGALGRTFPVIFDECKHQAEMTRTALTMVDTPLVLFVEHDTPLVTDCPIPWPQLEDAILTGDARFVRLHHEALVLDAHQHLMLDQTSRDVCGAPMRRTVQWSQRPHLAATSAYRWLLERHIEPGRRTMIEDVAHGLVEEDWREFQLAGWDRWRLWMYAPEDGNMKRSYHLDGRGDDPKYTT